MISETLTGTHPKSFSEDIEHVPKNRMVNINIYLQGENSMTKCPQRKEKEEQYTMPI